MKCTTQMPLQIFSKHARIPALKAKKLLKCYADRLPPKSTAEICDLSSNTVYKQYDRIRHRLIFAHYYRNGAHSLDEHGLSPELQHQLRLRRGITDKNIYPHAAELIDWAEEWPAKLVLKHIGRVIDLSGPLDVEPELTGLQLHKLHAYVRYALVELILDRSEAAPSMDETQLDFIKRAKITLDDLWRAYRTISKQMERARTVGRRKARV